MEDPLGDCRTLARRYRTTSTILFFMGILGTAICIAVVVVVFSDSPFPGWMPLAPSSLGMAGWLMVIAGGCGGFLFGGLARQMGQIVTGPVLTCWTYPEMEWRMISTASRGGNRSSGRTASLLVLTMFIPILFIVLVEMNSGTGFAPQGLMVVGIVIVLLTLGCMMLILLASRYGSRRMTHSPHRVIITPQVLMIGTSLHPFFATSGRREPGDSAEGFFGFFRQNFGTVFSAGLDGVLLRKNGQWFLDFFMTFHGEIPRSFTLKIPVPRGEEVTAERVLAFFTPRSRR